jgi:hypothetical protein
MQIAFYVLRSSSPLTLLVNYLYPTSPILFKAFRSLMRQEMDTPEQQLSKVRVEVLRRDRYRCRGCDRAGDEITLSIYRLEEGLLQSDRTLSLCARCHEVATDKGLTGQSLPNFLRNLWRHRLPEQDKGPRNPSLRSGVSFPETDLPLG